jgi:hypothetical protein
MTFGPNDLDPDSMPPDKMLDQRPKRRVVAGVVVAALLALLLFFFSTPREPKGNSSLPGEAKAETQSIPAPAGKMGDPAPPAEDGEVMVDEPSLQEEAAAEAPSTTGAKTPRPNSASAQPGGVSLKATVAPNSPSEAPGQPRSGARAAYPTHESSPPSRANDSDEDMFDKRF